MDDNSTDNTAVYVRKLQKSLPHLHIIVRKKNRGLGSSIKDGILASQGSIIVGMDADFNHDPNTLPFLLQTLQTCDLVVASRFKKGGGMADGIRMLPTFLFNGFFRILGMPIWDNTSGYYAIRKKTLLNLGLDRIYYGYGDYHLRLVAFAHKTKLQITEVPTYYKKRLGGVSKSKFLNMIVSYTKEVFRLRSMA